MASTYTWKLKAMLKKNLLLMKRNIVGTIFEIFFPMIMLIILIALRQAFTIETYSYESVETNDDFFLKNKSFSVINYTSSSDIEKWNGLSIVPPLKICAGRNLLKKDL